MKSKVIHLSDLVKYLLKSIKRKAFVLCFLSLIVLQSFIFLYQSDIMHDAAEQDSAVSALAISELALEEWLLECIKVLQELSSNQNMLDANMKYRLHMLIPELQQEIEKFITNLIKEHYTPSLADEGNVIDSGHPIPDKMTDFAQGTLTITLSHHTNISHVTLDRLPRNNSSNGCIDIAPKDFEVYGMKDASDNGTLLGIFTSDENGEATQTFKLPTPKDEFYNTVALHVLSNWGQPEYKCLYGFGVHGEENSSDDKGAFMLAFPTFSVSFDILNSSRISITFTLHFTAKYAVCLTFHIHPLSFIPSFDVHIKFNNI